jgi:hypothetical protein
LALIGNINETLMMFDLPSSTTIDELDAKTISIHIAGVIKNKTLIKK